MESSELGTLKPCLDPTLNFPPHWRRPLQSQTYSTFVRILSHCNALQSTSEPRSRGQDGNGGDKLGEVGEHSVNESFMELDSSLVQQMSPLDGAKENDALKDGGSVMVNELNLFDVMGTSKQGNAELMPIDNVNHMNSCTVSSPSSVMENHNNLSSGTEQNVFDRRLVNEVYEAVNPSTSMEVTADMPRPVGSDNEKSPASVVNFPEGIEHELQLKQTELEKLISGSENLDFSVYDFADEGIEEGEISGGDGLDNQAIDLLFEDAVSLGEEKVDEVLVSEVNERELVNGNDRDGRQGKYNIKSSLLLEKVEGGNDIIKLERDTREGQNATNPKIFADNVSLNYTDEHHSILETGGITAQVGGVKDSNHSVISSENLARRGQITYEDITEIKGSATAAVEVGVGKKKRGPLTKERKAKKKRKDRIKRAEKNKKLGVKRLKVQPSLKSKKTVYCRHYVVGRCQEGEKCKFSHDTTPLTKSRPCTHFARHSCMKGDDCPFDHQLSKYPCNNVVTKGFCSRGADCLFNHEVSSINDPSPSSKLSMPELKSPLPTSGLSSGNQLNKGIADQHIHTKFSPIDHPTCKFSKNQVPKNLERSVAHIPKGISFISHVRSTTGNTGKHEETASNLTVDKCVKISSGEVSNQSDNIKKSNDIMKGVPLRPPKGINFLSFGKSPLDASSSREKGASGSFLCQFTKNGSVSFSPESVGGVKIDNQTGSGLASVVNKMANEDSPVATPRGIKFLSVVSFPLDNASAVRQSSISSGDPACIHGKQSSVDGLKFSSRTPNGSASSSHPLWKSLNQGAGNCGGNSGSSKTSVQSALESTLAFAAKIESEMKLERPTGTPIGHDSSTFKG